MSDAPTVKPNDCITIEYFPIPKRAVVYLTRIEQDKHIAEIVYFDDRKRAMADDVYWKDDHWEFLHSGPTGTPAEAVPAAQPFIAFLELGLHRK